MTPIDGGATAVSAVQTTPVRNSKTNPRIHDLPTETLGGPIVIEAGGCGAGRLDGLAATPAPTPPATPATSIPSTTHFLLLFALATGGPPIDWRTSAAALASSLAAVTRIWKLPGVVLYW